MSAMQPQILFVHHALGAPTRYRVDNHVEQARLAGLAARAVLLEDLRLGAIRAADLLYLHRLRLTRQTLPLLAAARLWRIPVVYDSDDLVWDAGIRQYEHLDAHHSPAAVRQILAETRRARWLIGLADALVLSTPYLAARARQTFRKPAFVHPNALSAELLARSEAARARQSPHCRSVTVGYFSGTRHAHDEDLASVGQALRASLDAHPHVRLLLVGEVALPEPLAAPGYASRVERRPAAPWRELPALIAGVDITIAPLIDNPQRRAKSAVKYLEAAAVGVPTVASRLDPYMYDIIDGATGRLADSAPSWALCLDDLIRGLELRSALGGAALRHVCEQHTASARAPAFQRMIERILGAARRTSTK